MNSESEASEGRSVINVLPFCCSGCNETINGGDYENADQIFARLQEHVTKCPVATFTFDGTTDVAGRELTLAISQISLGSTVCHQSAERYAKD